MVKQDTFEQLLTKQEHLKKCITDRRIRYTYHDAKLSFVEAVLARGDRRLSKAIEILVNDGVMLDAWDENFDFDKWMSAFERADIDPAFYTSRGFGLDEVLPWDIIDCGVTKAFLLRERANAYKEKTTPSCREQCSGCGANCMGGERTPCPKGGK